MYSSHSLQGDVVPWSVQAWVWQNCHHMVCASSGHEFGCIFTSWCAYSLQQQESWFLVMSWWAQKFYHRFSCTTRDWTTRSAPFWHNPAKEQHHDRQQIPRWSSWELRLEFYSTKIQFKCSVIPVEWSVCKDLSAQNACWVIIKKRGIHRTSISLA